MKKLKLLYLIVGILLFCRCEMKAQSYYYNDSRIFYQNGYNYKCDKSSAGLVDLYNDSCQYINSEMIYKNDSIIKDIELLEGDVMLVEKDSWSKKACDSIVNNAFSDSEKLRVINDKFMVSLTIDSNTGRIIEVYFTFYFSDSFGTIPVETYRKLELNLKRNVWLKMTDVGKQLKFVKLGWRHKVQ